MTGQLANHEQLPFQRFRIQPVGCTNEQHFHVWRKIASCLADVGTIEVNGHGTPAKQCLTLLADQFFDGGFARGSLCLVLWQKDDSCAVVAGVRQFNADVFFGDAFQKAGGQPRQHACTVTRVFFATTCAAVIHMSQNTIGIHDDRSRPLAFDMSDETNATVLMLIGGVVQAGGLRSPERRTHGSWILVASNVFHVASL